MNAENESWIAGWLDESLSSEEERNLMTWLEAEPGNLRQFVEANLRDQLLREAVQAEQVMATAEEQPTPVVIPVRRWPSFAGKVAAIAAVIALGLFLLFRSDGESVQAEVLASNNARLSDSTSPVESGTRLSLKRFQLESGSLELALNSGVTIEFLAPVDAVFESDMRLRLFEGKINADVGERGKGFTVVTDAGEVIDLGTRFGVEADRGGESRVAVFSGKVEVHPNDAAEGDAPITLTEGQAARFSVLAGLRRWDQVALAARAAGLASKEYAGIVSRVRDNRGDDDLHPFYGIVRGGLQPGALAFTDKPNPRWAPRSGDRLPEWLGGADLIRTYHQFRMKKRYELTISLREPATIYVMIKAEQSLPAWLTENFSDTGATVAAGPFQEGIVNWPDALVDEQGLPHFHFAIWKVDAPAGDFVLGSARNPGTRENSLMYGLAVQPKNPTPEAP